MSLADLVSTLVKDNFEVLGDLRETVDYVSVVDTGTYDPVTDTTSPTTQTVANIKIVGSRFKVNEIDSSVNSLTDKKYIIPAKLIIGVTPSTNDYIMDATSTRWNVQKVMGVPGNGVWILHVRQ